MINSEQVDKIISYALEEDIESGDITAKSIFPDYVKAEGIFLIKDDGVIAGLEIAKKVFKKVNAEIIFNRKLKDGDKVINGDIAATVKGSASSILTAERTALNFMQRMSGIATAVNLYQEKINHTKAKIIDTRKTVPGLRLLNKLAVRTGGAANHRMGLYDMFLIKDNHIAVAGSISKAIEACKEFNKKNNSSFKIEIETDNLEQVNEALSAGVDRIMLDNYSIGEMKKAVELIEGKAEVEASGGITFETIQEVAETGVDFISIGAVTHSVKALDISLDIIIK